METVKLYNGVDMPCIGFGTDRTFVFIRKNILAGMVDFLKDITIGHGYHWKRDTSIIKIVKKAPQYDCHLFDTSSAYGQSERVLGKCLKKYSRDEYFIVTKLSNQEQREGNVRKALMRSLKHLNVDCVDLYLMHWPQTDTYLDCWKQMEQLYKEGLARAIGVCNFKEHHFEELMKSAEIKPMVCQIESHPLFSQNNMLKYCKKNSIQMMAYTPTGRMDKRIRESEVLRTIAEIHHKDVAQVIMRWHYQRGVIPIANTTHLEHLQSNMNIFDFCLEQSEMESIDNMNIECRLRYDPDTVDFTKC